jgi:excisionase family DNA binding protein
MPMANGYPNQHLGKNMEKFCIVRRRKQSPLDAFPPPLPVWEEAFESREEVFIPGQTITAKEASVVSLSLTQGQSQAIRNGGILPLLGTETAKSLNLNLQKNPDGTVVFNFYIDPDHNLMMLKPDQVCRMMQISRHSLSRMVKQKKIKSHKIGRLRRFCLKDIVEALSLSLA